MVIFGSVILCIVIVVCWAVIEYQKQKNSCKHEWETIRETMLSSPMCGKGSYTGHVYHLRCKKCGEITKREIEH